MFFKKEVYVGNNDEYITSLVCELEKNAIKTKIVHSNTSHGFDVPRGAATGRIGTQNYDMVSVYVRSKDYDAAVGIMNSMGN